MTQPLRAALAVFLVIASFAPLSAQGPSPEIREMVGAIVAAANGDDAAWAAYEQKYFSPGFLKSRPPDLHQQIVDRFGTVALGQVSRMGPDAPLELSVSGSKASGTISLSIDGDVARVLDLKIGGASASARDAENNLPPIPIDKTMTSEEIDRRLDQYLA